MKKQCLVPERNENSADQGLATDDIVEVLGFFGYSKDEKTFILSPEDDDFVEYTSGISSLKEILGRKGANVYPRNKNSLFAIIIRPSIAIDFILRGFIDQGEMEKVKKEDGREFIVIRSFEFLEERSRYFSCVLVVIRKEDDYWKDCKDYNIYATDARGKLL